MKLEIFLLTQWFKILKIIFLEIIVETRPDEKKSGKFSFQVKSAYADLKSFFRTSLMLQRNPFIECDSSMFLLFYYLTLYQNKALVTSLCMQLDFGGKRGKYHWDVSAHYLFRKRKVSRKVTYATSWIRSTYRQIAIPHWMGYWRSNDPSHHGWISLSLSHIFWSIIFH